MEVALYERRERASKEDKIRLATGADTLEVEIERAGDIESVCTLIKSRHRSVKQKGRELIESIFWMGGAIERADSLSEWGDKFFINLSQELGISVPVLRKALNTWHMFHGDIVRLYNWYSEIYDEQGKVLVRDLDSLIKDNRPAINTTRHLRKLEGSLQRMEVPEEAVKKSGLRSAINRRRAQGESMTLRVPKRPRLPEFRKLKTLKAAKEALVFDPEHSGIPIEEVTLSDGVDYQLMVRLVPLI